MEGDFPSSIYEMTNLGEHHSLFSADLLWLSCLLNRVFFAAVCRKSLFAGKQADWINVF
jgi:hypothetical protein